MLASLLLRSNRLISVDELIARLWDEDPPKGARNATQTYVMRLRNALGSAGNLVRTQPNGYVLDVAPAALDLDRFHDRVAAADLARSTQDMAAEAWELRDAMALWRGDPLSDVPSEFLRAQEGPRLIEERLRTRERLTDVELALGRHTELIGELYVLTEENPLRERFWGQLMLALHRSDRQSDALAAYQKITAVLRDELGVDPSGSLRELHQRILADDCSDPPRSLPRAATFQVPADIPDFVGRADLLDRLLDLTTSPASNRLAVPIGILSGPPGVGKTALAVHVAHRLRPHFPDGQLYADLRGFSTSPPLGPDDALTRFLRALGVPGDRIPGDTDEQGALLRSRLSGRKVLMILDNAASPDQVRPLLPADAGCAVLITSRNDLRGLAALNGARPFPVGMVSAQEAKTILANVIGAEQVAAEPEAADAFVAACGLLPLGLRLASSNLASSASPSIADYLRKLRPGGRLDAMQIEGDSQAAVRVTFDLSYSALEPSLSRFFKKLSLIPGPDFDAGAAAAVSGLDPSGALRMLDRLTASNLLGRHTRERFHFHDLIREFAAERAGEEDSADERGQALGELFAFYLRWARPACLLLYPDAHTLAAPDSAGQPWEDPAAAMDWLDTEAENLVAMVGAPSATGLPVWSLADAMQTYLQRQRHDSSWLAVFSTALAAAERSGDPLAQAGMHRGLGQLHLHHTRYAEARAHMAEAARLFHAAGDAVGEARAHTGIGAISFETGYYDKAIEHYEVSLLLEVGDADPAGLSITLFDLGLALVHMGHRNRGETRLRQAQRLAAELRLPNTQMRCELILAMSDLYCGELGSALQGFTRALDGWQGLKDQMGMIEAVTYLAETSLAAQRPDLALTLAQRTLTRARRFNSPWLQISSLVVLGRSALATDDVEAAGRHLKEARNLAQDNDDLTYWNPAIAQSLAAYHRRSGCLAEAANLASAGTTEPRPRERARAYLELAAIRLADDDPADAIRHARQACAITAEHGYRLDEARALQTLAMAETIDGDPVSAQRATDRAAAIFKPVKEDTEQALTDVMARLHGWV
ncbi:DNA-binding transcriptional activator of the SARP family [Amycolatopsis xylanica]|uniref:DNA-binding transcriptional activator of the SARP family n=1 Tax=Amycolatopsis xylanica TaxID=589385 RepID=A0A1H3PIV2_9PSEU|nr:DNA-binding transcriptional activator of the SARP family [Amycolatopsis xylanica]